MISLEGITGFFDGRLGVTSPAVDLKSFARACHTVARAESGSVERFEAAGIARSYRRALPQRRDAAIAVLCNAHFPWIAFAEAIEDLTTRRAR